MGKTQGFGSQLVAPPAPPPEVPPDRDVNELIYLELKKIRERVAPPKYEVMQFVNGTISLAGDFDTGGNQINAITVDVQAGQLNLWLTIDGGTTNIPPYVFTNVGQPFQMLIVLKDRHISWTCTAACLASITLQAL